jgi:hypothetical protein
MVYLLLLADSPVARRACWSHCQVSRESSLSSSNKDERLDRDPVLLAEPVPPPVLLPATAPAPLAFLNPPGEGKDGVTKLILPFLLNPFEFRLYCLVNGVPACDPFQRDAPGPPRIGEGA